MQNILPKDGEVYFHPHFFPVDQSAKYFHLLNETISWKQEPIWMFGKQVMQPRLTAWYGDPEKSYRYSGITMHPSPWTPALMEIKSQLEALSGIPFNSALLNLYRHEQDSMGWHRDNETELGLNPVIGSVSFGSSRMFHLRHHRDKKCKVHIELTDGSVLLMRGATQHHWEHALPKRTKPLQSRINITFRRIV